jgi:hypothetical protein
MRAARIKTAERVETAVGAVRAFPVETAVSVERSERAAKVEMW